MMQITEVVAVDIPRCARIRHGSGTNERGAEKLLQRVRQFKL